MALSDVILSHPEVPGRAALLCPEILYQIFLALFYDKGSWHTDSPLTQFPWNIAAICRAWRATCLSSPKLWTRILAVDAWHQCISVNESCIHHLSVVRCFLQIERSQSMPLIVDTNGIGCAVSRSVIRAVGRHSHRFSAFRVVNNDQVWEYEITQLLPSQAQLRALVSFEYHPHNFEEAPYFAWESPLKEATSLQALKIIGPWSGLIEAPGTWRRLRHVFIDNYLGTLANLRDVLGGCPSLVTLGVSSQVEAIGAAVDMDAVSSVDRPILLEHLAQLEIATSGQVSAQMPEHPLAQLLPHISAPNLTTLAIKDQNTDMVQCPYFQNAMKSFLAHSGSNIRTLEMSMWIDDEGEGAPAFLHQLPNLQHLIITNGDSLHSNILLQLIYEARDEEPLLFPNLRHLRIVDLQFDPVLLVYLISTRQRVAEAPQALPDGVMDYLTRVEVQSKPIAGLRKSIEAAVLAGLATCTLDPSFSITFDPGEFITLNTGHQWVFGDDT